MGKRTGSSDLAGSVKPATYLPSLPGSTCSLTGAVDCAIAEDVQSGVTNGSRSTGDNRVGDLLLCDGFPTFQLTSDDFLELDSLDLR